MAPCRRLSPQYYQAASVFKNIGNVHSEGEAPVIAVPRCPDHYGVYITFSSFTYHRRTTFPCLEQLRLEISTR